MGFRNYDPGLNSFLSRDMYNGALADLSLGMDPWNANRYAFAGGNPISLVELDGHRPVDDQGNEISSPGSYNQTGVLTPPSVNNGRLQNILDDSYAKPGKEVYGDGKAVTALIHELATGEMTPDGQGRLYYHAIDVAQLGKRYASILEEDRRARLKGKSILTVEEREIVRSEFGQIWDALQRTDATGKVWAHMQEGGTLGEFKNAIKNTRQISSVSDITGVEFTPRFKQAPLMVKGQSSGRFFGKTIGGLGAVMDAFMFIGLADEAGRAASGQEPSGFACSLFQMSMFCPQVDPGFS